MTWLAPLLLGYLLGSVPFGLILARAGGAGDLRQIGSGNIGATNVLRTGRRGLAATTLLLDGGKGFVAVWLAARLLPGAGPDHWAQAPAQYAAIGALLGHCFPVWLRLRGGKGVATMLGVALALAWPVGLACMAVWLVLLAIVRISSVAGVGAALAAPLAAAAIGRHDLVIALGALAALVAVRHRANLARLLAGEEPRVGKGR